MPRDRESEFAAAGWEAPERPVAVPRDVLSGETVTLEFDITDPVEVGSYTEHFNLVEEGFAWFSDTPPGGEPQDDAFALDIMVAGDAGGTGGSGGTDGTGDTGGGGCSVGQAPQHDGMLSLLGEIAVVTVRRRRTPTRSHAA